MVDDVRTLMRDIIAPDLKALAAPLDALEKAVKLGCNAVWTIWSAARTRRV